MSLRSFIEINHDDYCYSKAEDEAIGFALRHFINGACKNNLPCGFRKIDIRHSSDRVIAAREGYAPAQDECDIEVIAKMISRAPFPSKRSLKIAREIFDFLTGKSGVVHDFEPEPASTEPAPLEFKSLR